MRIGTRASALALAQATWVRSRLDGAELVEITTSGDRGERILDKSRWVSELERALLEGEIDLAVHSAKDVPGELAAGTDIVAVPGREDPRDVIVGAASLDELPHGARVGTSSLRRAAQLRALRDDLQIVGLRGNVDTRLRKLAAGEADAIVLAAAGLRRLGREAEIGGALDALIPAPGQGVLALQARVEDAAVAAAVASLHEPRAGWALAAERAFARVLGASCHTPVGAVAYSADDGWAPRPSMQSGEVGMSGWIGLPDGSQWVTDTVVGPAGEVADALAERMVSVGARELLERAATMVADAEAEERR